MLFCPVCGNGYDDKETCPNCEEKLAPRFDEQQMQSPLVVVEDMIGVGYIHMAKELLEENGIYCQIEGGCLLVPELKAAEARELIRVFLKGPDEAECAQKVCPGCGQVMPDYKIMCPNCGKVLED